MKIHSHDDPVVTLIVPPAEPTLRVTLLVDQRQEPRKVFTHQILAFER